jgi:hypothetical protein
MTKPHSSRMVRIPAGLYRLLLYAYPAPFRRAYGEPMGQLFRDCCAHEFSQAGYFGLARHWWRTLGDLASTAIREWVAWIGAPRPIPVDHSLPLTPRALQKRRSLCAL